MTTNGFIKISRSILDWAWYQDANTFRLFVHLLLTANFADGEYKSITVKRGQCLTSISKLKGQTKMSEKSIRVALNHLKRANCVAISTTPKYSVITILNYDNYQTKGKVEGKQGANKGQTERSEKGKPIYNKEEIYNKKNKNKNARARENTNELNPKVHNFPEREDIDFEGLMDSIRKRGRRDECSSKQ